MKKAFTMIELVFVLVIIGILSSIIGQTTKTNPLQEAAIQLASHIRYTQHLALVDDRYNKNRKDDDDNVIWYKERWQLEFGKNDNSDDKVQYTIFSDTAGNSTGDANFDEIAINPQNNNQVMSGGHTGSVKLDITDKRFLGMKSLNIGKTYEIDSYELDGGCSGARISFDHLGRPFKGKQSSMDTPYNNGSSQRLVNKEEGCKIILTHISGDKVVLRITRETGFVCILKTGTEVCQ